MMSSSLCALQKRLDAFEPVFLNAKESELTPQLIHKKMSDVLGILQCKATRTTVQWLENNVSVWSFAFDDNDVKFDVTLNDDCSYAISEFRRGNTIPIVKTSQDFAEFKRYILNRAKRTDIALPKLYDK